MEPGYLVFARGRTLFAQRFDADRGTLAGDPMSIGEDLASSVSEGAAPFAAAGRTLAFSVASASRVSRQLRWYGRHGEPGSALGRQGQFIQMRLSHDSTRVLLGTNDQGSGSQQNFSVLDLDTGVLSTTVSDGSVSSAVWSPDDQRIAFVSVKPTAQSLNVLTIKSGEVNVLKPDGDQSLVVDGWLQAGSAVVFHGGTRIFSLSPGEGNDDKVLLDSPGTKQAVSVDPSGTTAAFVVSRGAFLATDVFVADFPSFRGIRQVSNGGGSAPRWRSDGHELYFLTSAGKLVAVPITRSPDLKAGAPVELFASPLLPSGSLVQYEPSPDGQRFLLLEPVATATAPLSVILNWTSLLTGPR